jgi:chorismate mutase
LGEETQNGNAPIQVGPNAAEAASTADQGPITAELAASLPLAEVKRRLYAESEDTAAATPAAADTSGEGTDEGTVNPDAAGTERDEHGRFVGRQEAQPQGTETTEEQGQPQRRKNYGTIDEAVRDLDAVRGNLTQAAESAKALQRRVQELESAAAQQRQQAEVAQAQAQHQQFENLVAQLPTQAARDQARQEYQQVLARQAMGEYQQHLQTREQTLEQREFSIAKAQIPSMYQDIARFVADNNGIPHDEMLEIVNDRRVANLIASAQTPEAIQAVSISLGELLDFEASRIASRTSAEKAARREAKSATKVADVPQGVTANAGGVPEVDRIKAMTPAQFTEYKRRLFIQAE